MFDRFPGLKLVFVETEVNWIGPALQRFDDRMAMGDEWTAFAAFMERERAFSRRPSEYWDTNCYAGISPFHPAQLGLDQLGSGYEPAPGEFHFRSDRSMFGVDYPHFESIFPGTADTVAQLLHTPTLTDDDARRILFDTAADVYGSIHGHRRRLGRAHSSSSTKSRAASSQPKKYTEGFPSAAGGGP